MTRYEFTPTGWYAAFEPDRSRAGSGRHVPVETWSSDGDALVVDAQRGRLVAAHIQPGFAGLQRCRRATMVLPTGPGWRVREVEDPPEPATITPVIGWVVYEDSEDEPLLLPVRVGTGWAYGSVADVDRYDRLTLLAPDTPDTPPDSDGQ